MENLWSGTDSGLSKDWDDDFDDMETPISYDFPYATLASQAIAAPVLNPLKKISSRNKLKGSEEVKDSNILQSKKTYSKKRKNPLFFDSEISPRKLQKGINPSSKIKKTPELELPVKSPGSGLSVGNHSKDDYSKAMSVVLNNFSKTERMNGVKYQSIHNDVNHSKYGLFDDVDECLSLGQTEGNASNNNEESILSNERPKTEYKRTRKNLKQQMVYQMQQSVENISSVTSVTNNYTTSPIGSKRKKRGSPQDSNNSVSGSDGHEFLDFQPPPPKKELSLMDMVKKYSEEVQNSQSKCDGTNKKKKNPTRKSRKSEALSGQDDGCIPSLRGKGHQILNKNPKELPNEYIQGVYPVSQLASKKNSDRQKRKSVKKEKAPRQKKQTRTPRAKSVQSSKTEDKLNVNLSTKCAQSLESNSFISHVSSICPVSHTSTQAVFNSSTCNRVIENASTLQIEGTKHLSQTAVGNEVLPPNIETFHTSKNTSNEPVAPFPNAPMGLFNRKKLNLSVKDIKEQLTVEQNFQTAAGHFSVNPSSSVHCDQSKESEASDSESETSVVNHRTFSLLGADFFCHMYSVINSISRSCAVQCLEDAEDWIAETPYSRELTVKEFCNNPLVMNVLLEFFNGYPDFEKLLKLDNSTKVIYEFPEDFQNVPIYRMLKDYVDQVLQQMVPPDISPAVLSFSSQSVLEFAFNKMPFRECAIMSLLFSKGTEVLKYADMAAKLNFVALLVIFDEFRQREIES